MHLKVKPNKNNIIYNLFIHDNIVIKIISIFSVGK